MYTWKKLKIIKVRIKGYQRREIYKAGKQKLVTNYVSVKRGDSTLFLDKMY